LIDKKESFHARGLSSKRTIAKIHRSIVVLIYKPGVNEEREKERKRELV
jgi:hypothetical protein